MVPPWCVSHQLGHNSAAFTLSTCAHRIQQGSAAHVLRTDVQNAGIRVCGTSLRLLETNVFDLAHIRRTNGVQKRAPARWVLQNPPRLEVSWSRRSDSNR